MARTADFFGPCSGIGRTYNNRGNFLDFSCGGVIFSLSRMNSQTTASVGMTGRIGPIRRSACRHGLGGSRKDRGIVFFRFWGGFLFHGVGSTRLAVAARRPEQALTRWLDTTWAWCSSRPRSGLYQSAFSGQNVSPAKEPLREGRCFTSAGDGPPGQGRPS